MAARYALQQVVYYDSVAHADICIVQGAKWDSTSQAHAETPSSMWSTTALTAGSQIDPKLAAWLLAYPSGGVS
jgi:hypothetical protein